MGFKKWKSSLVIGKNPCYNCRKDGRDLKGDNFHYYGDEDGGHCFSCGWSLLSEEYKEENGLVEGKIYEEEGTLFDESELERIKSEYEWIDQPYRGIYPSTYKYFGVMHKVGQDGGLLEQIYPTFKGSDLQGFKRRILPKTFTKPYGDVGRDVDFFGQFRFLKSQSRDIIISAGEIDCMSIYQVLKEHTDSRNSRNNTDFEAVPVVSSTLGEEGTKVQAQLQYDWLNRFERILVCFDDDAAGKKALEGMFSSLPKGKMFVMELHSSDPNECLDNGDKQKIINAYYKAKPYAPVGVLGSSSLAEKILEHAAIEKIPLPPYMHRLQDLMAGGIPLGVIVNLISSSGTGKCFAPDTKILMHDMTVKNVQDVVVGDKVMGDDGTPRNVVRLSSGIDTMYKVNQVKGDSYTVNSNHILSLKKVGSSEVVNVGVEDYVKMKKWKKDSLKGYKASLDLMDSGEFIDKDLAYLLGLWLAEGSTDAARLTIGKEDKELIEFVRSFCETRGWGITTPPSTDREGSIGLTISGGFRGILGSLGMLGNKHVPKELKTSGIDVRRSLIAGFIDGDGYKDGKGWEMTLKDNQLVPDLVDVLRSVGLQVTVKDKFSKCKGFDGEIYKRLHVFGDTDRIPNKLTRKSCEPREQNKNPLHTGISVECIGMGEFYGFEVDGNHLFCLADFTVTHNSTHVDEIIYHWIFNSPYKIGIMSLESDSGEYGTKILSRHVGRKINLIEDVEEKLNFLNREDIVQQTKHLFTHENGQDRFMLVEDRDGSVEEVKETVERMVTSGDVKVVVIDPLQDLIACLPDDEQNKFMSWQKGMVKSHGITFFNVNHTKKSLTGGGAGSQGVDLVEEDTHGSSSIYKSGACNLLFSRDKEAEDIIVRNTTIMKMSKCRWTGNTTPFAGKYYYDNRTHTVHDFDDWKEKHPEMFVTE